MTHLLRELKNTDDLENIREIQFSLFSHNDIKNGAVSEILTPDSYDGNIPKNNGLFDHNMGSIDAAIICPTDEKKEELCPGYFGKIDLALPVFNYHFMPYIEKTLKCVCFRCSNLLIDKTDPNVLRELNGKKGYNRFIAAANLAVKNKKCLYNGGCFVLQPTKFTRLNVASIKEKNNIIKIIGEFSQNAFKDKDNKVLNQQVFTPLICYQIFKKIKDEDVDFLGMSSKYSRPEWMVITSLAVPPPSVRPSIRQPDNQRCEDDLTYALSNIVKANKSLKQLMENNSVAKKIDDYQGWLQYVVTTYMDNEIPGVPPHALRSSFRPLKSITQRLKGKDGRIRGNIMGKRVDYSARTVISVDPNIDIDEFGVPLKIAMNLTIPEIVTKYNINKLKKMVLNGPSVYPGAKTVGKNNSTDAMQRNFSLKHVDVHQISENLELGDVVHRHLMDGDICLFNRQPTLHRMSMMGHRIRVLPHSTFRLNINATEPYNADFDGDEMNMHVPQSLQTHEELKQITLVQTQIISPGTSSPSMGIIQDTLIGGYLLTANDNKIKKYEMNNLMMFAKNFDGIYPTPAGLDEDGQEYWTGKQLYSLILPDLNIKEKNITIVRGEIVDGFLDKTMLGRDASGLIKQIYNSYGAVHTKNFFNDTEKLVTRWMMGNSFSIGFGDCILTETQREEVKNVIRTNINPAYELIKKAHNGIYMPDLDDKYKLAQLETDMTTILSKVDEKVNEYINKNINKKNNLYVMSCKVGSAGSELPVRQIIASVGPQLIWGERVSNGFSERTLPHYPRNDLSPEAKGFVRHSFIEGTDPAETFFIAMSGRTGTISTAIKTAESGYISRKLIKASEELKVNYDFTIRNSSNNIIQFCYGDDNMDPSKLEKISKIELIEFNNKKMLDVYQFDNFSRAYFEMFMLKDAVDKMMADENFKTILEDEFKLMMENRDILRNNYFYNTEVIGDIHTFIPFNLYRIIPSIRIKFNIEDFHLSDITPQYVIDRFNTMINDIMKYLPEKNNNWKLFIIIFKTLLSPKRIIMEYRFTKSAYDYLLDLMKQKMIEGLINPGELVGIIAAQTLGQNTTQLTLNTFHTAGSAAGSAVITDGLPRLLEIINITKNLKNSNMCIYLKDEYSTTKEEAQKVRAKFTYTKLKDLLLKSEILFDNKNGMTDVNEDREFIRSYKEFTEYFGIDINEENSFSPWILRLIFDKETMMNRKITVQEIQEIIKENSHNDQDIECIFSDDSSSNIVMRIRIKHDGKGNFLDFMKDFEKQLIELTIRGIDKIESLALQEMNIIKYSLDGSLMNTKEWVLNTNGSNLIDIMCQDDVDTKRTTTNNILEFFEIFGIEATRSLLYAEIKKIFTASNPNPRHIQMFADLMTYRGKLMTIDRHGVNKNPEIGPIGKASFEEVMNIFTKSALFAEKDNMKGVSSNILAGQFCPAGTNNFELMMDEEKIIQSINNEYEEEIIVDTDVDRIFQQTYGIKEDFEDINEEDFEFGFGLENNKKHLLNEGIETDVAIINDKSKDVEKIVIDEKNLEEVPIEPINYSQNVDFDAIELEDPTYKEQNKEKKVKIVRKKK
jgi:DNA-directed RNA polymerase II subunit RPB1